MIEEDSGQSGDELTASAQPIEAQRPVSTQLRPGEGPVSVSVTNAETGEVRTVELNLTVGTDLATLDTAALNAWLEAYRHTTYGNSQTDDLWDSVQYYVSSRGTSENPAYKERIVSAILEKQSNGKYILTIRWAPKG